jgi:L-iditol 2-dehydrogenase
VLATRLHAPGDLRLAGEPRPVPRPEESLVRVTAVGICGSDLHWWDEAGIGDATLAHPLVLGHEAAGVIEDGPHRGTRVAIDPAITCGTCSPCRAGHRNLCTRIAFAGHGRQDGALREYLAWPSRLLHPLPDALSDAEGALLEPLGVALHALDLGHLRLGGSAVVAGCGPLGLLLVATLRAAGAARVIAFEPLPHRREAARAFGADPVLDPAEADFPSAARPSSPGAAGASSPGAAGASSPGAAGASSPGARPGPAGTEYSSGESGAAQASSAATLREAVGEGVDVAFEMAGADAAIGLAMAAARPGGRVVLGGIPVGDRTAFQASVARRKGLTVAMVRRANEAYPRAIRLVASGAVDLTGLVTHRFGLARAGEAFAVAAQRQGIKVIIEPGA